MQASSLRRPIIRRTRAFALVIGTVILLGIGGLVYVADQLSSGTSENAVATQAKPAFNWPTERHWGLIRGGEIVDPQPVYNWPTERFSGPGR